MIGSLPLGSAAAEAERALAGGISYVSVTMQHTSQAVAIVAKQLVHLKSWQVQGILVLTLKRKAVPEWAAVQNMRIVQAPDGFLCAVQSREAPKHMLRNHASKKQISRSRNGWQSLKAEWHFSG